MKYGLAPVINLAATIVLAMGVLQIVLENRAPAPLETLLMGIALVLLAICVAVVDFFITWSKRGSK